MSRKIKNTIPVYNIGAIGGANQLHAELIAERFAPYLLVHPNLYAPHKHDFYHVVLFTKGKGTHTVDFEQFEVKPREVYFMVPGQVHSWSFEGETDGYIINFSATLLQSFLHDQQYLDKFPFFKGIAQDSVLHLSKQVADEAAAIMEQIIAEVNDKKPSHTDAISSLLIQLFILIHRDTTTDTSHLQPQQNQLILSNFRKLVEQYYTQKHLPKEYAELLYITPNYLNSICKDMLGKPAGQVIRDRILLEAKRLLVNASLNVEAISNTLSFADNSYFTKFFKKYTGLTPEAFRKQAVMQYLK